MFKMMTAAAFAVATLAAPAVAQMGSGSMGGGAAHSGGMTAHGTADTRTMAPARPMTRAQRAAMKRCESMSHAWMMRNAMCVKMMRQAHGGMAAPHRM